MRSCQENIIKKFLDVSAFLYIPICSSLKSPVLYVAVASRVTRGVTQGWSDTPSSNFAASCPCHNIGLCVLLFGVYHICV